MERPVAQGSTISKKKKNNCIYLEKTRPIYSRDYIRQDFL